jgi:hypothetical protein
MSGKMVGYNFRLPGKEVLSLRDGGSYGGFYVGGCSGAGDQP